ncbi:MAG: ORF6N domain-containing protein [Erysipelotrichaceae bacterium]|nr:ORF6N domain-containing protein [Erysipelotrichaceae bacterium]
MTDTQPMLIDERTLKDKIYTVRGQQVMLDSDLAEIYGYSTKAFNQQVKNNIGKFDEDFRFQLTEAELDELSLRSKFLTLNAANNKRGLHYKYLPYAFTEQGIYILMTALKAIFPIL